MAEVGAKFKAFLEENSTPQGEYDGVLTLNKLREFEKSEGFTESEVKKIEEFQTEFTTGMYSYVTSILGSKVDDAKKEGASTREDFAEQKATIKVNMPNGGMVTATAVPFTLHNNPQNQDGKKIIKYASITMNAKLKKTIEADVVKSTEAYFKEKLGIE